MMTIPDFTPFDNFVLFVYAVFAYLPHMKRARGVMAGNVAANAGNAFYLLLAGSPTGVILSLISASSSLTELILPVADRGLLKVFRIGVGVAWGTAATFIFYESIGDAFICVAVYIARFAETIGKITMRRAALVFGTAAWTLYAIDQGLIWMAIGEIIALLSNLLAIYRNRDVKSETIS
jgi:hypothetical protein